ncbi:glycoside hydrolase family 57 protein [Thiomicrorhabdus sp.]|uniref:glycoside hydrolase family 57 protein n=1 Tax=Thiomicrorhabdus sp. TaxID=2039724 RepID=UPI0029C61C73|nr:glycoside hydrolase family 57 protein [Thiomicrorhabdus sp.]
MEKKRIKVVLCWHMHQPHYRDGLDGVYRLPWVYLHAIKDYTDMAWHLEEFPQAKVVVNFAPVLLEQLDDYDQQMSAWLEHGTPMSDPLLNWVAGVEPIPQDIMAKEEIIAACLRANGPTMIDTLPKFKSLAEMVTCHQKGDHFDPYCLNYLSDQFFVDLLMWYHLAWMGMGLRQDDERIQQLMDKGNNFDAGDQKMMIEVIKDALGSVIPRYKKLQEEGRIEISMTPYGHPIVPLLIDFNTTKDAMPHAPLPEAPEYPDGYERAKWHMEKGMEVFDQYFGHRPKGVWLSEGALSSAAVGLLDEYGFKWTASGEGVWRHSCEASHIDEHDLNSKKALYQPLQHASQNCALFFRDDGLSDLIGFQYKDWNPQDAAGDFVHHLQNIGNFLGDEVEEHVVTVILDGENAWEYYPDNAQHFLSALYDKLSSHPRIEMTTFSDALESGAKLRHLPTLKAGSWVYGSFSTWIGDKDKNRGWDLLVEAKECYDEVMASGDLSSGEADAATNQLAVCEGSDWFWWFGDYNPSDSVKSFDRLYRRQLMRLYRLLKVEPPETLDVPISSGGGEMENSGTMRRN